MVYLLHLDPPYKHARHYLGMVDGDSLEAVLRRLDQHRKGQGARLCQVAVDAGSTLRLVRVWRGGRQEERRLKNRKGAPALCPICGRHHMHQPDLYTPSVELASVPEIAF